ncbi:MAG: dihydroneopterin aldolase [Parachlamydiales bacterium]
MIGTVGLEKLRVTCKIGGISPGEKVQTHDLYIDVQVESDMSAAVKGDHLTDAVDYTAIADLIEAKIQHQEHRLIETVAYDILNILFDSFSSIGWAWVRVTKREAHTLAGDAFVELESFREEEIG